MIHLISRILSILSILAILPALHTLDFSESMAVPGAALGIEARGHLIDRPEVPPFQGVPPARIFSRDEEDEWEWTGGPSGAVITALVTTPLGTLLAGTDNGGLYRSEDGGDSWTVSEDYIEWPCCNYTVPSLAASASAVYAGTWGGGVVRSHDDGYTWTATGILPGDPYPIVLGLIAWRFGDTLWASGNFGVVRSDDAGDNWYALNAGLPETWVGSLARRGTDLYARLDDGVYRFDPDTSVWSLFNEGLYAPYGNQSLISTEETLFLATHEGGVFHLDCDDGSWSPLNDGLWNDNVDAVVQIDRALYAGLMGSGVFSWNAPSWSWEWRSEGLWNLDVRVMGRRGPSPYAGTFGGGVFRFDPDALIWQNRSDGMTAPLVRDIEEHVGILYAGTIGGGVWWSEDQGETWTRSEDGPGDVNVHQLASDPGAVYAATWNGIWKSTDMGESWAESGLQGNGIFALDSLDDFLLYAGSFGGEVWSSTDSGDSWDAVGTGLPGSGITGFTRIGGAIYAALSSQGVWVLPAGETTWTAMNDGLPELNCWSISSMNDTLYLGMSSTGVQRWNMDTLSWVATALDSGTIFKLQVLDERLMAGGWGILFGSMDGGQTWSDASSGLKPWLAVHAISPGENHNYIGLDSGGIWRSPEPTAVEEPGSPDFPAQGSDRLDVLPNPFSGGAKVIFNLDQPGRIELMIYDVSGRKVASLAEGRWPSGSHESTWDGRLLGGAKASAGIYLIRLKSGETDLVTKTVYLR